MLTKLIKESYIQLDVEANSFEEAITLSMKPLLEDNAVTSDYVNKVLAILEETGPYIVITEHVAIPHAPSDAGANKAAIGFTRLKKPIISGNTANDPVQFLFSLSSPTGEDHLAALSDLAELLGREEFLQFIGEVKAPNDFIAFAKNFERSQENG